MRIYKYELEPDRRQMVMMPNGARLLSVIEQDEKLVLYALVNPKSHLVPRILVVVTTGDNFIARGKKFIGSCILGGWFVAHVFEQEEGVEDPIDNRNEEDFKEIKHAALG